MTIPTICKKDLNINQFKQEERKVVLKMELIGVKKPAGDEEGAAIHVSSYCDGSIENEEWDQFVIDFVILKTFSPLFVNYFKKKSIERAASSFLSAHACLIFILTVDSLFLKFELNRCSCSPSLSVNLPPYLGHQNFPRPKT